MTESELFTRTQVRLLGDDRAVFVVHNVVYDVAPFLDDHPGGREVLARVVGQDATEDFDDIGHSSDAKVLMKKYAIGELVPEDRVDVDRGEFNWDDVKHKSEGGLGWRLPLLGALVASLIWLYFV